MKTKLFTLFIACMVTNCIWAKDYTSYDFKLGELYYSITEDHWAYGYEVQVVDPGIDYTQYSVNDYGDYYDDLTTLDIPESVQFNGNTYEVTSIGPGAFMGCKNLETIKLPNSIKEIRKSAFKRCPITTITIPENVNYIGQEAFDYTKITSVIWNAKSCPVYFEDNYSYSILFDNLSSQITSFTFGETVDSIPDYICYNMKALESVVILDGATHIGTYAFSGCNLTTFNIPNSIVCIGERAFMYCYSLSSITLSNNIKTIEAEAFYNCSALSFINLPNTLKTIGESAFYKCPLNAISIPSSVTSIGAYAFEDCDSLVNVIIPNNVVHVGCGLFANCDLLQSVTLSNNIKELPSDYSIRDYGFFQWCKSLIYVHLPDSLETIGTNAFCGCETLSSITIPNSVTVIGGSAFAYCTQLTSFAFPKSLEFIGRDAFEGCSGLTTIFWNATQNVDIRYDYYNNHAFKYIQNQITSFIFGDSVEYITDYLCVNMKNITSFTIPKTVTGIGRNAFKNCTSLTSITFKGERPTDLGDDIFEGVDRSIPAYIPCGTKEDYEATWWGESLGLYNYQEIPEFTITVSSQDTIKGYAIVNKYTCEEIEILATANEGYMFIRWSDGSTDNPRVLELTKNSIIMAEFAPRPTYTIDVLFEKDYGNVKGAGTYQHGDTIVLVATANEGYEFKQWSNEVIDNPYSFIATRNVTLEAIFVPHTAIDNISQEPCKNDYKFLHDGQILILHNGNIYNVMGQEIE